MVYQYSWRRGDFPVPAQAAGEFLRNMTDAKGSVSSKDVLEASRDESALLHPCFEWDDARASEKYRLYQANKLIGSLICTVVKEESGKSQKENRVRAFVNVTTTGLQGSYKPIIQALSNEEERQIVLENAKQDLIRFRDKYSTLTELSAVFRAIDEVVA